MIKKLTLFFLGFFLFIFKTIAGTPAGGQVTYRYLSSYKFEVTYKIYRDCRGIGLSNIDYTIRCASSGATKKLTGTRVSISDINLTCPASGVICKTPNGTNSGTNPGVEEQVYMDTLDFNGSESAFKSCCIIQIGTGQCCRTGAITTGGNGNDFWVYSTLDFCKAANNSSPVFTFKPSFVETASAILMKSFSAKDTIDGDSLSYHFTDPLQGWTSKTSWSGNTDSKNPFTAYYPSGYNKANGPRPDLNPPYGIYLDPITGNLIAVPTNNSELTIMAVAVREWRKDGSGKYNQIGEIVIDQQLSILNSSNHIPSVGAKTRYNICEGESFTLNFSTDDQPFTQTPPASTIHNDTLTITWDKGIKKANYTVPNPSAKHPDGKFEWTPASGDSKKSPYYFAAIVTDNNCPLRARTIKNILLYVYPKINVTTNVKKINNNTYSAGISISNKKYNYVSGKFITSNNAEDIRNYYFKSSKALYSTSEIDTLVFKKNGTYILNQTFLSETECNTTTLTDTIKVSNLVEVTMGINSAGNYTDTSFCKNQSARTYAKVINAKKPVTYTWKTGKTIQSDTLGYFDFAFSVSDTLFLSVKDANGQTNSTFRKVNVMDIPDLNAGNDVTICPESNIKLKAKNKNTGSLSWSWTKDNKVIANVDSVIVSASGKYITGGTNANGCTVFDTLNVLHFTPIKISLNSGVHCQYKNELTHSEIINGNPNLNFNFISWKLLKSLPKLVGGQNVLNDLFSDKNPNSDYDFNINFSDSRVNWPNTYRDSIIFSASAIDTNGCKSSDTMTVSIIKTPIIQLSKKIINYCINTSFNLDSFGNSGSQYNWVPFNRDGFGKWPSLTPLTNGKVPANYFSQAAKYKIKMEANNEFCIATDSLIFTIFPLPRPIIGVIKNTSTIKFRDETINEKSHKWYINNVFFSADDTMLLSKTFVHLQPIKLEVTDNSGCTNDTTIIINTLIGINKIVKSNIEIYPNPASNILVLKQSDTWVPSEFEIYDVLGKKVISGITKNREEIIDLKQIKPGSYCIKYLNENGIISIPFIKSE
ncbi:MAG: T9SS type A sorting domain-containing protein [Bacteroidia bacterium]